MSPKRPDLVLSTDIPNVEACVLVRDGLDVESDGRDGVDFACGARRQLEGVEDGFGLNVSFDSCSRDLITLLWDMRLINACPYLVDVLVFPAASRPSISRRISLLPKILAMEREIAAPIVSVLCCGVCDYCLGGPPMR